MNVGEQILQGLHRLKRERGWENIKLGVAGGEGKRNVKALMTAMVQEVLWALPKPRLEHTQRLANDIKVHSALSTQVAWVNRRQHCV